MSNIINIFRTKPILALAVAGLLFVLGGVLFTFLQSRRVEQIAVDNTQGSFEEPTKDRIAVPNKQNEEVAVNNVYKSDEYTYPSGTTVFEKNEYYQLLYSPEDNTFDIAILTEDFAQGRTLAEAALIEELNIPQQEACTLNVRIYTHPQLNLEEADKEYGLSFCE